tara:strand:- start:152 stop:346 length:195 start_codon:yes stop_codon:yes gene_type:complete
MHLNVYRKHKSTEMIMDMSREEMEDYVLQYGNDNVWALSEDELEYEVNYIHMIDCAIINEPCWN